MVTLHVLYNDILPTKNSAVLCTRMRLNLSALYATALRLHSTLCSVPVDYSLILREEISPPSISLQFPSFQHHIKDKTWGLQLQVLYSFNQDCHFLCL